MGRDRSRSRSPKRKEKSRRRSRSRDKGKSRHQDQERDRERSRDRPSTSKREYKEEPREPEVKNEEDFDQRQKDAKERRRNNYDKVKQENDNVKQETGDDGPDSISQMNVFAEALRGNGGGEWGKQGEEAPAEPTKPKEKPNLGLSGALTADTNTYKGVVIKYSEPSEAKIPKKRWRFYPFKGDEALKIIYLHRQSAYLVGRLSHVCEIPVDHPSCSKQHAAIQFRAVKITKPSGRDVITVRPYIIDLESSNGTFLNNTKLEPKRYYEMREKDVVKFGFSTREYVLLHEKTDTTEVHQSSSSEEEISDSEI